jgi:hypothetical protein
MPIRLFVGTSEKIAKAAPTLGIKTPEVTLTNVYGAYQAFMAAEPEERWAIVEIQWERLHDENMLPASAMLKGKARAKATTWRQSLDTIGFCVHDGPIPPAAMGKVWIFNPRSNWLITQTVLHVQVGVDHYDKDKKKLAVINRWLTGEFITVEDWLAEQKEEYTREQQDQMRAMWDDRSGLDLFFIGAV